MGEEGRLNSRGLLKVGMTPLWNPSVSPLGQVVEDVVAQIPVPIER